MEQDNNVLTFEQAEAILAEAIRVKAPMPVYVYACFEKVGVPYKDWINSPHMLDVYAEQERKGAIQHLTFTRS